MASIEELEAHNKYLVELLKEAYLWHGSDEVNGSFIAAANSGYMVNSDFSRKASETWGKIEEYLQTIHAV